MNVVEINIKKKKATKIVRHEELIFEEEAESMSVEDYMLAIAIQEAKSSRTFGQTILQVHDNQLVSIAPNWERKVLKSYPKPTRKPKKSLKLA